MRYVICIPQRNFVRTLKWYGSLVVTLLLLTKETIHQIFRKVSILMKDTFYLISEMIHDNEFADQALKGILLSSHKPMF